MAIDFTNKERDRISHQLEKSLGQEYLSVRSGAGNTRFTYVEGWKIINLANKIFGFDGWSSEIKSFAEEYCDTIDGKISMGYSCICRVTLKNGIFKEDVGFGSSDNQKVRGAAVEKAKKEASTDALKRTLRLFGNVLGNCCYDKQYLVEVQKHKRDSRAGAFKISNLLNCKDLCSQVEKEDVSFSQDPEISDT